MAAIDKHEFASLRITCHQDIFRHIDMRFADDTAQTIIGLSDTGKARFRYLIDHRMGNELIEFLTTEIHHYKATHMQA